MSDYANLIRVNNMILNPHQFYEIVYVKSDGDMGSILVCKKIDDNEEHLKFRGNEADRFWDALCAMSYGG